MKRRPLQTTVVGCGAVAHKLYLKPLRRLEKDGVLRIVGLVDPSPMRAGLMRQGLRNAQLSTDLAESLRLNSPDLVLILSPAQLHAEQTMLALRHGCHVLCEKPVATTLKECEQTIKVSIAADRIVAVAMVRRFFPAYWAMKGLLQSSGPPRRFEYNEGRRFEWEVTTAANFRPTGRGGSGVLLDLGPHVIDTLTWFFGPLHVTSCGDDAFAGGVESNVVLEVESEACSGMVRVSWDQPMRNELRVYGDDYEAVLRIDQFDQLAIRRHRGFEPLACSVRFAADLSQPARRTLTPRLYTEAIYCQLIQMARAIALGELPAVPAAFGLACMSTIEAARRTTRPLPMPWLGAGQAAFKEHHWAQNV